MNHSIEIPLSKIKISMLFLGSVIFVYLGFYLFKYSEDVSTSFSPIFIQIIGVSGVLFFGVCALFIGSKLIQKTVGLKIDEKGITDNSNATSVGLVDWEDITGMNVVELYGTKIIVLKTSRPYKYINRTKNPISKRAMKSNLKMYGSPISIISNSLKIKFDKLEETIANKLIEKNKISKRAYTPHATQKVLDREDVAKRFKYLNYVIICLFFVNLIFLLFIGNLYWVERTAWALFLITGLWLAVDEELLQIDLYYLTYFILGLLFCAYGYFILFWLPETSKATTAASISISSLLFVQWPLRKLYRLIFKREPEFVSDNGPFSDLLYTLILFFGGFMIAPMIITDYLRQI